MSVSWEELPCFLPLFPALVRVKPRGPLPKGCRVKCASGSLGFTIFPLGPLSMDCLASFHGSCQLISCAHSGVPALCDSISWLESWLATEASLGITNHVQASSCLSCLLGAVSIWCTSTAEHHLVAGTVTDTVSLRMTIMTQFSPSWGS